MDYKYLPERFQSAHEVCWYMISEIEDFILNDTYSGLRSQTFEIRGAKLRKGEHMLDYFTRTGRVDDHNNVLRNHIINSFLIDMTYFLQEALECSLKRRLVVTFSLLRKPLLYNYLVLLRLVMDDDFFPKFNSQQGFDPSYMSEDDKKHLIELSLSVIVDKSYTIEDIYDWLFNKDRDDSIVNMSQKALHLTTNRGKTGTTELQNFNFVFSSMNDIDNQWEYLYNRLPAILNYIIQVLDIIIGSVLNLDGDVTIKRLVDRDKLFTEKMK